MTRTITALLVALVVCGCGRTTLSHDDVGQGGAADRDPPSHPTEPTHVEGRWALFAVHSALGVEVKQAGTQLRGTGCLDAAPPFSQNPEHYCARLTGDIRGRDVSFGFSPEPGAVESEYHASTVVSRNGQRMTGRFSGPFFYGEVAYPTAWLRLPDGAAELPVPDPSDEHLAGDYDLRLLDAPTGGADYVSDQVYRLYHQHRYIAGDLGSFWFTEMSNIAEGSPLRVGPVPATSPELPISLLIDFDAEELVEIHATTALGHEYRFEVRRSPGAR